MRSPIFRSNRAGHFFRQLTASLLLGFSASGASAASTPSLIIFGDSLSDVGNSYAAGNTALIPPNYATGEYTDGTTTTPRSAISGLYIEQLATMGGWTKPTASSSGGFDYAFAGAVTGTTGMASNPGMGDQVATFLHSHPAAPTNALYVIWGGGNDLDGVGSAAALPAAEATAISNLKSEIAQLAAAGAKNILWLDLPPLGDTPAGAASGFASQLNASSAQFQQDWNAAITQLKAQYPSINLVGLDVYSIILQFINTPATFGLTNETSPAQGLAVNPDTYVFWDSVHPTTRADQLLAQKAFQALPASFLPQIQPTDTPTMPPCSMLVLAGLLIGVAIKVLPTKKNAYLRFA
jgi:phospholipase/lecithinase/hemolysin